MDMRQRGKGVGGGGGGGGGGWTRVSFLRVIQGKSRVKAIRSKV